MKRVSLFLIGVLCIALSGAGCGQRTTLYRFDGASPDTATAIPTRDGTTDLPPAADTVDATIARPDDAQVIAPLLSCAPNPLAPSLVFYGTGDLDFDEDGIPDSQDTCPATPNSANLDSDGDGLGDACDSCPGGADRDGDGICDNVDNCPEDWNPTQVDQDGNGKGNACDSQNCFTSLGPIELQRILPTLLRHPEIRQALANARWRVIIFNAFCSSLSRDGGGSPRGLRIEILDYTNLATLALSYLPDTDEITTFQPLPFSSLQGPQPSAEEDREAIQLAAAGPDVRARLAGLGKLATGYPQAFFYEFGDSAADNDPDFSGCLSGRCVDVLYAGALTDGGRFSFSVVVDLATCTVLGAKNR